MLFALIVNGGDGDVEGGGDGSVGLVPVHGCPSAFDGFAVSVAVSLGAGVAIGAALRWLSAALAVAAGFLFELPEAFAGRGFHGATGQR